MAARIGLVASSALLVGRLAAESSLPRRPPTFGTGIEVTRLSVTVTNGRNRYVTGLSEGDFAVFEDGVRQDLASFAHDPLPLSVSLLVDCSASMEQKLPLARAAAMRFLQTLGTDDLAQIVQFNDRTAVLQDFTSDRRSLEAAIAGTRASGSTVLYTALYVAMKQLDAQGRAAGPRRRAVVLLSDGRDTASVVEDAQVLELSRKTEIAVYAIGLTQPPIGERERLGFSESVHFLTALARETGGQVYFPRALPELDEVYGTIGEELRTQYTLGYVSANKRRDGKWRRIVVRTPDHPDLQFRHKVGYYAPREAPVPRSLH